MAKNSPKFQNGLIILALILLIIFTFNQFYTIKVFRKGNNSQTKNDNSSLAVNLNDINQEDLAAARSYIKFKKIKASFMPSGIPEIYGQELGISFDKVQEAIDKVKVFGPTYGEEGKKIVLTGANLERYKKIGASIACEYCCGVKTLTQEDGSAACGCAHSIMMRGLAAYLIKNHPNEFSDEQILKELAKWKITYFPKESLSAKLSEMEKAGDLEVKNILKEFPDFLPQMVGGC